jgi:hypothetical protein
MSSHRQAWPPLRTLLLVLMVVPPISFLAALPWLKHQPDGLILVVSGIATTVTVVASLALAILHDRKLDEWQRSNARFSSQWGWTAGACLVALLLALPPLQDLIVSGAATWGGTPNPDRRLVLTTFAFGFMAVVAAQGVCTVLLSIGWVLWKSRSARETA